MTQNDRIGERPCVKRVIGALKIARKTYPKILMHELFGIPAPMMVVFGITNKCNLRCEYCFARSADRIDKELPTERLLDYIDQFVDMGTVFFNLQGGEPTLHPELGGIISHITARGAVCTIATNGLMADRHLEHLRKCHAVCLSIDGFKETTDAYRGKGAYETAARALDSMSRAGVKVRLHGIITQSTSYADMDHVVGLAKRYGVFVNFAYALDTGARKNGPGECKSFIDGIKKKAAYILELKKRSGVVISSVGAIRQALNWPYGLQDILIEKDMSKAQKKDLRRLMIRQCLWGRLFCYFNPDGKLYLCARGFDREGFYVEIGTKSIKEAFGELVGTKTCYMCGQIGDSNYASDISLDNLKSWVRF